MSSRIPSRLRKRGVGAAAACGLGVDAFIIGGVLGGAAMSFGIVRRRRQQAVAVTVR